jgi:hypothetical protein
MREAIQQIVDFYVRLNDRQALEDLKMQWCRLADDVKSQMDLDVSMPILQIDEEIAVIEAGIERLNRPQSASCPMPLMPGMKGCAEAA